MFVKAALTIDRRHVAGIAGDHCTWYHSLQTTPPVRDVHVAGNIQTQQECRQ